MIIRPDPSWSDSAALALVFVSEEGCKIRLEKSALNGGSGVAGVVLYKWTECHYLLVFWAGHGRKSQQLRSHIYHDAFQVLSGCTPSIISVLSLVKATSADRIV